MESRFHCQKTKAGEKYFCVLEKMRVTISNHDICKKTTLRVTGSGLQKRD
jgi:hypothetical protein